jgi:hypothetical protein
MNMGGEMKSQKCRISLKHANENQTFFFILNLLGKEFNNKLSDLWIKTNMRLFLQIDIGDWKQRAYSNLLVPYASSLADDLIGTDIDSESESAVIDLVIKLAEQAESLFVFISVMPDAAVGSADKMMQHLHQSKIHQVVVLGENSMVEKYAQNFEGRFLRAKDNEEVKKRIHDFAKKILTPDQTSDPSP